MKKILFLFAGIAALTVSCQKEPVTELVPAKEGVEKTFTVISPETRTSLDGLSVKWAEGDEINVVAATTGNQYTFTLSDGAGTSSATFTGTLGEDDAEETVFYAVYPNVAITSSSLATDILEVTDGLGLIQTAVKDGFDPHFAVMTAVVGEGGKFTFRHGVAYFKVTIGNENVVSVNLKSSSTRFGGRPKYVASTGAYSQIESAKDNITLAASEGTLEYGATYYVPVLCKNSTLKTLTLTYTFADGKVKTISTDKKASTKLELGKIYNLGTPTFSFTPEIAAKDITLEADATSGEIVYSIENPVDGVEVTASLEESIDWISNIVVSEGKVSFNCLVNEIAEQRYAVITLSYEGAEDVEVTVKQKAASSSASEDYVWDFSTTGWQSAMEEQAPEAKDTKASNWGVSYDGLSYTAGSDDRWSVNGYIQPNGSGYYKSETNKRRYFLFETFGPGYVYVTVISNANSEKTADICAQLGYKSDADFKVSTTAGSESVTKELGPFSEGGEIAVFLGGSGLRIQKIEFHTDQQ